MGGITCSAMTKILPFSCFSMKSLHMRPPFIKQNSSRKFRLNMKNSQSSMTGRLWLSSVFFGKIALLADGNAFYIRRHDGQDTWTNTNVPSFEQILNWDKFFFDVFFKKKDNFLKKIYSRKATYFYVGKYYAFVPPAEKKNFSEEDLRKMAKQNGLLKKDVNLISRETYDAWLSYFAEKRHKALVGKNNSFRQLLKLRLRVLKRYIKFDLWGKNKMENNTTENKSNKNFGGGSLNDKLEIFIITYNRKQYLKHTLEQVYSKKSPIRNFKITILDNKSTDGTSELIDEAIADFPNSKHVIHNRNIGGNGNIARCYELASKEYFWILCDDDEIDWTWSSWSQVESAINNGADCIVVSNYLHPKDNIGQLLGQLSFVPAGIYKTENLTDTVMQNIGFQVSCCFPQLALVCKLINDNKRFVILDDWIVKMVEHPAVSSYTRGMDDDKHPLIANMTWSMGFMKTIQMIHDEKVREEIIKLYHNENGIYMLHPNVFLNENIKGGNGSFLNRQEFYGLLPDRLKLLYSYETNCGSFSYELADSLARKINGLEASLVRKSFNYRVGQIVLFLPKLILKPFIKLYRLSNK